ncbi:MAG: YgfZ/GcvT domain-containing protein [Frankiaceae bacterium]
MRSPLLDRPGAVPADPPDEGIAAHYGDPFREQRRLAAGDGLVDLSDRGVVTVTGPDRLGWLHSLTTQHLTALPPGTPTEALVLSPHGHVEHHLHVLDDGETTWLHVEPGTAGALVGFLDSMRFMLRVEVADVTDGHAVVHRAGRYGIVPRERLAALPAQHGDPVGLLAHEALRVAAGVPRLHRDTDQRTIPHEIGWLPVAVHLDKGCYRGQETVARVHNLGRPPRRLVLLHLDGSADVLPAAGTEVTLDGARVGSLGTAVHHYELGPIALALVKRTVPDGATLAVGGMNAAVEPLPGLSYGELAAPRARPRLGA